ncbi:MAG: nucleoside/nucleotide kinase family protein [Pseudomonadota bacterium]
MGTPDTAPISLDKLVDVIKIRAQTRIFVGLAGAPASGKSTTAHVLKDRLEAQGLSAAVVQMDGFHYDDWVLEAQGLRARKGAPETFDVDGFAAILKRLRTSAERDVAVPVFDRSIEIARAGAAIIPAQTQILIVEGNYVLLDQPGWREMADQLDLTVMLDVPEATLTARLLERWRDLPQAEALAKLDENDLPNGRLVRNQSRPAQYVLTQEV